KFEEWYQHHHGDRDVYALDEFGEYADKRVQSAFNVWQARAALQGSLDKSQDRKDAERFRWLTEDHTDAETRTRCREILDRMSVMSYSAACVAIDHARRTEGDGE